MNHSYDELRAVLPTDEAEIYAYVIATIGRDGDRFVQYGSAPNWQGGVLTLCTCKHYMRSFGVPEDWRGRWVAGFSGVKAGDGRNALVFLARVTAAYDSQAALWRSNSLGSRARNAKAATRHRHGDLFEPKIWAPIHIALALITRLVATTTISLIVAGMAILTMSASAGTALCCSLARWRRPIFGVARVYSSKNRSGTASANTRLMSC